MTEDEYRAAIIAEARSWAGTPYHHSARLKGVGADCMTFIVGVYENVGLVAKPEIPFYRPDFMFHSNGDETYLNGLLRYGHVVESPKPGDVVLYKRTEAQIFAHGAIVIDWPERIIHCFRGRFGVIEACGDQGGHAVGVAKVFLSVFPLSA